MSSPKTPSRDPGAWTPAEIDAEIERWIEMRLSETERAERGVGRNYVFDVELSTADSTTPPKRLVKIGCTTKSEYTRLCQIKNTCQHNITLGSGQGHDDDDATQSQPQHQDRPSPPPLPVRLYKRVEKLVHAELAAHVYHFDCACGTAHHEYFDIDRATALRVQDKWRTFVTRHGEPYDGQGNLLPFWRHRLRLHTRTAAQSRRGAPPTTTTTHQRWQALVEPSLWERLSYDVAVVAGMLWGRRWQALALSQAFFIACCLFPCFSAFILFSAVGLGVLVESGFEERLYSLGRLDGLRGLLFASLVR
ncbi:GIY-YIG nuclease family protein [Microdochium nivale]|nr:GIY-YIG nuclease family protein [Microdochium nivale]